MFDIKNNVWFYPPETENHFSLSQEVLSKADDQAMISDEMILELKEIKRLVDATREVTAIQATYNVTT